MQPTMPVREELDYDMWLGPAPLVPYTEKRVHALKTYTAGYDRPGWYGNRTYCDGGICNWGHHPLDVVQWGNDSELTGPVEIDGRGEFPPADGLWNVILGFELHYCYANGVELFYCNTGRKTGGNESVHVRFEGAEGWVCAWYGPDRLEAEPKSILTAEVKPEDFPFPLENEKRNFLNCVKTRQRTLEDAEVGHRSSSVAQLGYIGFRHPARPGGSTASALLPSRSSHSPSQQELRARDVQSGLQQPAPRPQPRGSTLDRWRRKRAAAIPPTRTRLSNAVR